MSDWRWLDAFKRGQDDLARELREETDRSLRRDPGRWSSKQVDDTPSHTAPTERYPKRFKHEKDPDAWGKKDWRHAKADYEQQQRPEPTIDPWIEAARASREIIQHARDDRERPFQARPGDDRWR